MACSVVGWARGVKGGVGTVRRKQCLVFSFREKRTTRRRGVDHVSPTNRVELPHDTHDAHGAAGEVKSCVGRTTNK